LEVLVLLPLLSWFVAVVSLVIVHTDIVWGDKSNRLSISIEPRMVPAIGLPLLVF
jgi:hypothetical protein